MLKFKNPSAAAAGLALTCLAAAPAKANTIPVTYVSGKGTDSGDCSSPVKPCRMFQFAVNQTAPGGEVKALDPADYSPVTITNKAISITGVEGAGIDTKGGTGITINGPSGIPSGINLANLVIQNVSGTGTIGIGASNSVSLTITHCTVRGFNVGINLLFGVQADLIADTVVTNNQEGIQLVVASGNLVRVVASQNKGAGVSSDRGGFTAIDTIAEGNGTGFSAGRGGLSLGHSTAIGNGVGVNITSGGTATSFGDNHIKGNSTADVQGTLTNVGTQ